MADDQLIFPQAYLAMGNGDLVQVTNFRVGFKNGAKQMHTLRKKGAGIVLGNPETTCSFDSAIDEDGVERDHWRSAQKGEIKQLRAKLPGGKTLVVTGAYSSVDCDGPLDDAVKVSCEFIGKLAKQ